jgi:pyruvate dehydrogenase (quinone)/pyruvate oxidase
MCPQVVGWHLPDLMEPDAILCGDRGTVTVWQARMKLRKRQSFSFSGTMCSMAAALPYAIGAQTAYPDRQVVAFTGDGSLTMMMGDFATLVQHDLPVKVVVMKNNSLGLIKWEQMLYLGNPEYGVDLAPVDFVKFAEACGAKAVRIEEPGQARALLRHALSIPGPVLVECVVDPLEPPWPPEITRDEAQKLLRAMRRGERNTTPIGLTIGRHAAQEFSFAQSPFGIAGRIRDRLTGQSGPNSQRTGAKTEEEEVGSK